MALKMDYTVPGTTILVDGAYHRIERVNQHHPKEGSSSVMVEVSTSKDATDRNNGLTITGSRRTYLVQDTQGAYDTYFSETELKKVDESILEQSYMYLKSLPEYAKATDE
jgi:hypothetical protein